MDPLSDHHQSNESQAAVAVFAALVALGIAGIGLLCRLGFADNTPLDWAKYVGLSWFLICFSLVARKLLRIDGSRLSNRWWTSHASLSLAALAFAAVAGVSRGGAGTGALDPGTLARGAAVVLTVLGAAGFVFALAAVLRRGRLRDRAALLAFAGLFALYAAGAAWGSDHQNPLFVEDLCFGHAHIDTLFHASVCNMLRTYGVPSTGLDGVPFMPYHFGSHWIFARLCNLLDVRVIDFYNRGYPVVFLPLGVFSLGTLAVSLAQTWHGFKWRKADDAAPGRTEDPESGGPPTAKPGLRPIGPLFWLVLSVGYIGFLPYGSGVASFVGWDSIILSESYAVAVAVSFFAIAAAWSFLDNAFTWAKPRLMDAVAGLIVFSLLAMAIGLLKVSVLLVLAAAVAYFFFRLRLYRRFALSLLFAGVVLSTYAALRLTSNPGYFSMPQSRFVPFGFLRANVDPQWWPEYWFVYYAWVWAVAAVRLREEGIRTLGGLFSALRERRLLDLEFVFVAALVGAGPGMLITYSSTHYFSNYQQWLAVGFLLSVLVRRPKPSETATGAGDAAAQPSDSSPRVAGRSRLERLTIGRVFAGALMLSVCGTLLANTLVLLGRMTATNLVSRGRASGQTGLGTALMHGQFRTADRILAETASEVESHLKSDKSVLAVLRSLDEMPLSAKRSSLVFIPQSNRQFWELVHGPYWPADVSLVAPALSGVAMIDGLHIPKEAAGDIYWYHAYSQSEVSRPQPPLDRYLPVLRRRCASMGFRQLIVIDVDAKGISEARCYDCRD